MNGAEAKVFVITGPSGVGKGTLIRRLLERFPDLAEITRSGFELSNGGPAGHFEIGHL